MEPSSFQQQQQHLNGKTSSKTLDEIAEEEWSGSSVTDLSYKTAAGTRSTLSTLSSVLPTIPSE